MEMPSLAEIIFDISGVKDGKYSPKSITGFELLWNWMSWSPFSYLGPGDC